ncbi:hypothetical protein F4804DRAFT_194623 [Jackrogersella minutella]|nr:hypothetical protein F4804DRAFT_194623 [Jackrogersella minutella]
MPSHHNHSGPDEPRNSNNTLLPSPSPGHDTTTSQQLITEKQSSPVRTSFSEDNFDSMRNLPANAVGPTNPDATWLTLASSSGNHINSRDAGLEANGPGTSPTVASDVQLEKDESRQGTTGAGSGARRKTKEVSIAGGSPEIIDKKSITEYRAQIAREMERQEQAVRSPPSPSRNALEKTRVSPIKEESSSTSSPTNDSDILTASTESNRTVRGGLTPGFSTRTPSYPFPRVATPNFSSAYLHNVLSQQSQAGGVNTTGTQFGSFMMHDQLRSDPSTPASAMTFLPAGVTTKPTNLDFPTPSLYDLTLMLSAEPGLEAWWNSVVQIMTDFYKAERVTLSVPADPTDVENVPWGQKATYNTLEEDELSLGYISKGTVANSVGDQLEPISSSEGLQKGDKPMRPVIQSRHSFTTYEDQKGAREVFLEQGAGSNSRRPGLTQRSKSYYPGADRQDSASPHPTLNKQALEEHDAFEEQQPVPTWEAKLEPKRDVKGRLLPVLQGLDFEADPLIDHNGITRVVERGKVIALTRTYPYLDPTSEVKQQQPKITKPAQAEDPRKLSRKPIRSDSQTKLSSLLASAPRSLSLNRKSLSVDKKIPSLFATLDDVPRPPTPKYEEYEQAPPSPWSQSPAPSPAVRADPSENPFFTDAVVDEESFNPGPSPQDYASTQPPETIGVDNSWTVLHVPLNHVFLSKPTQKFKLDSSVLEQKASQRNHSEPSVSTGMLHEHSSTEELAKKNKNLPIAILSILTPIIPYPSNLRYSLEHLAPHLAATFSLGRHYSNLETEVMGLHRKRPSTSGFGAIGLNGRQVADPAMFAHLSSLQAEDVSQRSATGSLTSPSEYSGPSRSINASPSGTPLWDTSSFGLVVDRKTAGSSPSQPGGDSYFGSVPRGGSIPTEVLAQGALAQRASRAGNKEGGLVMGKQPRRPGSLLHHQQDLSSIVKDAEDSDVVVRNIPAYDEAFPSQISKQRPTSKDSSDMNLVVESQQSRQDIDGNRRRLSNQSMASNGHRHTMLHSYGGDFSASFQSLPPSTSLLTKPTSQPSTPIRPGSSSAPQVTMLPPSDRLKGLMLDLLPVHVFVALPVHGEIVWVNSRYLTYRGQTLADLVADPWGSLHPEDREEYMRAWTHSLRSGDQFAHTVRLRRFDGTYRWHQARAVASRDKRGVIVQFIGSYMDIHDQKVAELMALRQEEIEISEAKHRLLANLIPQIIFTATENDGITFANGQWLAYTGQSDEDALGLGFIDFVHPDDLAKCRLPSERPTATHTTRENNVDMSSQNPMSPTFESLFTGRHGERVLSRKSSASSARDFITMDINELFRKGIIKVATDSNGRLSYTTEVRIRSKSGEYRWHLIRCVEIGDVGFGTGASSYFGSATDINDHKLLEVKLKEAMESKGRFLSNMSHEIRTPLIGISGMVSFLQDTTLNEEQRDYTNTIQTSANSLLMIINDILDLSKVDAGMMKLNFEWFHTRSLIEDVNELVSTMAIAKRLELNYIVEENVPSWVKGDKVRIRQVLLNVIGNAIKFTAAGEVFSRCRVYSSDTAQLGDHRIMLEFSVIDTGRGFSKEEAELIFKPFSQIDGSSTRQHGGSGLGLVISRQLVELHGGRMDGTAVPGKGSTFTFTSQFGLPSSEDHPTAISTPPMTATTRPSADGKPTHAIRPLLLHRTMDSVSTASPSSDMEVASPALESSGSSDPSVRSVRTQDTIRSSVSSVNVGLAHFSEAAKASGQDISQMKLEMPIGKVSPQMMPTPDGIKFPTELVQFRPPMYSILIICPQKYSREATTKHIEMTLPKDVPHQITAMTSVAEAEEVIGGHESVTFTHIVLNLPTAEEIIGVIDKIIAVSGGRTSVLVLTDSVQRQAVLRLASDAEHQQLLAEKRMTFVYKPVKPSRFAVIFDPAKERDLSVDLNRSNAAQMVENQKQSYLDVEKRIGNKGYKVLLVEDNPVNQKVLVRYLRKVGIEAEIAADGVECTEKVFAHGPYHYSLILCDLHMPRKDGYQACREIRQWETEFNLRKLPIIALSANVMSDVQEKCAAAGFNDYVTKPVDFVDLSTAMSKFF